MNYKTLLMASAAVLFTSQAMAQDLTGAFSVPAKGQFLSETSLGMTRTKTKANDMFWGNVGTVTQDARYIEETLEYGLTDKLSINAGIANAFDIDTTSDVFLHSGWEEDSSFNNDHNFAYTLGAKYNTQFDDVLFQVAGEYNTWNPKSWFGHTTDMRWQKNLGLDLKAGLDLGNGITPYIVYHIDSDIDTAHRELTQSVSVGVHKYAGKWALDGAIRYEWTKNHADVLEFPWGGSMKYNDKNTTETWLDVAGDYYLKDNVALGLYGSYLVDSHDRTYVWGDVKEHTNFDYELGLRVKVLF